ncbi:hypothetical protein FSP39_012086 [Pinctada imbricata]|uniref:C-type lectin domain-containing protein n=1 Tax=Pinctada imbricata TaxID=66713 RepID=A0AA89C2E0_PINIB|nr:hypothetical protein FSP39_012086 [Pinctada imbricata]
MRTDCGLPSKTKYAEYDLQNGIGLYSKVMYDCEKDYFMEGKPYIGCQDDGKWSPVRFGCFPVCDTGWKNFNRSCYKIPESKVTFKEAKIYCEEEDAFLADVQSEEENKFILALKGKRKLFLGGKYDSDVLEWRWLKTDVAFDGSGARTRLYTNWDKEEPNNLDEKRKEFCMGIFYSNKWHNWICSWKSNFVCKKNARA